jgi:hypothetical protein
MYIDIYSYIYLFIRLCMYVFIYACKNVHLILKNRMYYVRYVKLKNAMVRYVHEDIF